MTREEWEACRDPEAMLESLRGKATDRKIRLFAAACARQVWTCMKHDCYHQTIVKAEMYADGAATREDMSKAREEAGIIFGQPHDGSEDSAAGSALAAAGIVGPPTAVGEWWEDEFDRGDPHAPAVIAARNATWAATWDERVMPSDRTPRRAAYTAVQAALLRDIFNPFQPSADASWFSGSVVALAQAAYEQRALPSGHLDNGRLAVLADALEENGCEAQVLGHLRDTDAVHVRGCWVVDLLLKKA